MTKLKLMGQLGTQLPPCYLKRHISTKSDGDDANPTIDRLLIRHEKALKSLCI